MKFTFKLAGLKLPVPCLTNDTDTAGMVIEIGELEVTSEVSADELKQYGQVLRDLGFDAVLKNVVSEFVH